MRVSSVTPCICSLFLAAMFAQGPNTGSVSGTVTDASGAAVPTVKVTAASPALQGELTFITTEQGDYRFRLCPSACTASATGRLASAC